MSIDLNEMDYKELIEHMKLVASEIGTKAYVAGYEKGLMVKNDRQKEEEKSPLLQQIQDSRDKTIARAKEFVDRYIEEYKEEDGSFTLSFVVNHPKRTVVALIRDRDTGTVDSRGTAKCLREDCFNSYIGKAIALCRVLGLEVPLEFIDTPRPTIYREGDIITHEKSSDLHMITFYHVDSVEPGFHDDWNLTIVHDEDEEMDRTGMRARRALASGVWDYPIVDDSRAKLWGTRIISSEYREST